MTKALFIRTFRADDELFINVDDLLVNLETIAMTADESRPGAGEVVRSFARLFSDMSWEGPDP